MSQKIAVIIKNKIDASSYYRLYQYFEKIKNKEREIVIFEQIPSNVYLWYYNKKHKSEWIAKFFFWLIGTIRTYFWIKWDLFFFKSDIVILNRKFYARKMPVFQKYGLTRYLNKRRLIWDFDDNIIDDKEISKAELEVILQHSEKIIVTSSYLKQKIDMPYQKKISLLLTTDMDLYQFDYLKAINERLRDFEQCVNLLWLGSKNNVSYLDLWIDKLDAIAKEINKKVNLYVVCNKKYSKATDKINIKNIKWNRSLAINIMKKCHLGLMPLVEDNYTLGKAGFKIVQYFGAALPAAASAVGYNFSVIDDEKNGYLICDNHELDKIKALLIDKEKWKTLAVNARMTYEEKFNPHTILTKWEEMTDMQGEKNESNRFVYQREL